MNRVLSLVLLSMLGPILMSGCGGTTPPRTSAIRRTTTAAHRITLRRESRSLCGGPERMPSGDIAYCEIGLLLSPAPRGYSPPVSAAQAKASFKATDYLVDRSLLERSHPIASLYRAKVSWHNFPGVRPGARFMTWLVQVEVPFDRSFGDGGGPMVPGHKRVRIRHPSWVVCDAGLFNLQKRRWLGMWEGSCQGVATRPGKVRAPS